MEAHNVVSRHFKPILRAADLPDFRLYDLRHSSASLLLAEGVDIKVVSERLGHSDIAMTLRTYIHVQPGKHEEAAARWDTVLAPKQALKLA